MQKSTFDKIVSFLHGASIAFVILGTFITFKIFLFLGVIDAITVSFVFVFISLVILLFIDSFRVNRLRLDEVKKQTQILERVEKKLNEQTDNKELSDN